MGAQNRSAAAWRRHLLPVFVRYRLRRRPATGTELIEAVLATDDVGHEPVFAQLAGASRCGTGEREHAGGERERCDGDRAKAR